MGCYMSRNFRHFFSALGSKGGEILITFLLAPSHSQISQSHMSDEVALLKTQLTALLSWSNAANGKFVTKRALINFAATLNDWKVVSDKRVLSLIICFVLEAAFNMCCHILTSCMLHFILLFCVCRLSN